MGNFDNLIYEKKENYAMITINRLEKRNSIDPVTMIALFNAVTEAENDDEVRAVVITGDEKYFSTGGDVGKMTQIDVAGMYKRGKSNLRTIYAFERCTKPTIAAINGYALGFGFELALACDFRIVGENAKLGFPEVGIGIMPGAGGTQRLTDIIGAEKAKQVIILGDKINAETAYSWGLASFIVPVEDTVKKAEEIAVTIAQKPGIAVQYAKDAINWAVQFGSGTGQEYEHAKYSMLYSTEDRVEGMAAFKEKRQAIFKHK